MNGPTTKLLLRPEEAASYLAVGRTEVYRLIKDGELESVKIGRLRRITVSACERFVAKKESGE